MIHLVIPGDPVGDQRVRVVRSKGGNVHAMTPDKPARWKADALAIIANQKIKPIIGPIGLVIQAVLRRPQRLMRKKDPKGWILAADATTGSKPDLDNIVKLVIDTLVCRITAVKVYAGLLMKSTSKRSRRRTGS